MQKGMKLCDKCKSEIPIGAKICPVCHRKANKSAVPALLLALFGVFIAMIIVARFAPVAQKEVRRNQQPVATTKPSKKGNIALDVVLKVKGYDYKDKIYVTDTMYVSPDADNARYAVVTVNVNNKSLYSASYGYDDFYLQSPAGPTYAASSINYHTVDGYMDYDENLSAGMKSTKKIAFSVPNDIDVSDFELVYKGNDRTTVFKLK